MAEEIRNANPRRSTVVIRPEEKEKYYSGLVKDAAGYPILSDEADLTGYLQPQTLSTIFFYDKNGEIIPVEWRKQIDQYLVIWDTNETTQARIIAIDERVKALTEFGQKLIEFGRVVSKGSASFNNTVTGISVIFSLINKAFGAFTKVFFTALSWSSRRDDAKLISKVTNALKRIDREANNLLKQYNDLVSKLPGDLEEIAENLSIYQTTNTASGNSLTAERNAETNNTAVLGIAAIIAGILLIRKFL